MKGVLCIRRRGPPLKQGSEINGFKMGMMKNYIQALFHRKKKEDGVLAVRKY